MIILVYGEDTFRAREKVTDLRAAFAKKFDPTGLNLSTFGADAKPGDILQAVGSLPFLSQKRMVVIRDLVATTRKDGETAFAPLARVPESTIVVLWETLSAKEMEKKALYKLLAGAETHEYRFPVLEGEPLRAWAANRAVARGGSLAADAARELAERVGSDLWQMDNEIRKLVAYAPDGAVARDMVRELTRAAPEGEIFALVDAVSRGESTRVAALLRAERESGGSDFSIFGMLARQTRLLLAARACLDANPRAAPRDLAAELDVHPFVAQKALEQARAHSLAALRAIHDLLFSYDAAMKTGAIPPNLAVDLAIERIMSRK